MPKYSVLVTVYNSEKFLAECLGSILGQTYGDFEVVVVDDGSTDSSGKICDEFAARDSRVKVIHKVNEGVNIARKTAFENSAGEYIFTVDGDDIVDADMIETVDGILKKDNYDLVMFDLLIFDNETGEITVKKAAEQSRLYDRKNKKELYLILLNRCINSLCTKCCRREIYGKAFDYKNYLAMCHGEDWFQSAVQICEMKKGYYLQRPMYRYRNIGTSLSHSYDLDSFRLNSASIFDVKDMIAGDGYFDSEVEAMWKAYARKVVNTLLLAISDSDMSLKEKIGTVKSVTDTDIYRIAVSSDADYGSSKMTVLKFRLLKHGMYKLLFTLMKRRNS
ncbi:MAG TPA: hypothetical protein DCS04_00375 [Ruminococcaceae bacterium]|nr:hypothetical protein [Oscillospiraceae bacterium]